jgi:hypothetical protein
VDLRRHGADPSGAAASDAALVAALEVCGETGGTIRVPAGTYSFARPINLGGRRSIIIEGDGAATGGATAATRLNYTGSGNGVFINLNSARGCLVSRLQLTHSDPQFTGTYLSCVNDRGSDPAFCALLDCVVGSAAGTGTTHLNLDKCIEFTAERCNFLSGNPSVRGRLPGSYANVIRFRDCQWQGSRSVPVQGGGEAWTFEGCTFEPLVSGAAGGLYSAGPSSAFNGLVVIGCWFGDATTGGTWLDLCANAALISGNVIGGNERAVTGIALRQTVGVQISANLFTHLLVGIDFGQSCQAIVVQANICNTVGTGLRNSDKVPSGSLVASANYGMRESGK